MKAIQTRYLGATNTQGSRIKAWADGWGSVIIPYPHEKKEGEQAHFEAAKKLIERVNFRAGNDRLKAPTISGGLPNGDYVFCYEQSKVTE